MSVSELLVVVSFEIVFFFGRSHLHGCCGYGADGKNSAWGYDCLMIPGAVKGSSPYTALVPVSLCGAGNGLAYSSGTYKTTATPDAGQQKTVCCKYSLISWE